MQSLNIERILLYALFGTNHMFFQFVICYNIFSVHTWDYLHVKNYPLLENWICKWKCLLIRARKHIWKWVCNRLNRCNWTWSQALENTFLIFRYSHVLWFVQYEACLKVHRTELQVLFHRLLNVTHMCVILWN